ncbi:hypothetical protein ACLB1O_24245 [Escherichia coli]
MKFTVEREHLLKPLQQVSGPLGGRPRYRFSVICCYRLLTVRCR